MKRTVVRFAKKFAYQVLSILSYLLMWILVFLQVIPFLIYESMRLGHLKLEKGAKRLQELKKQECA